MFEALNMGAVPFTLAKALHDKKDFANHIIESAQLEQPPISKLVQNVMNFHATNLKNGLIGIVLLPIRDVFQIFKGSEKLELINSCKRRKREEGFLI